MSKNFLKIDGEVYVNWFLVVIYFIVGFSFGMGLSSMIFSRH
jgi:hypothetical protein